MSETPNQSPVGPSQIPDPGQSDRVPAEESDFSFLEEPHILSQAPAAKRWIYDENEDLQPIPTYPIPPHIPMVITSTDVSEYWKEQDKKDLERQIDERIGTNFFPWDMPNPQVTPEQLNIYKGWYEAIAQFNPDPLPEDKYHVATPLRIGRFDQKDFDLFATAGMDLATYTGDFTREQLQQAGVFFLNRVGEGEQPIFGAPIPDPDAETGMFEVQDRSFLTKEEFEKVYAYQQEHGFGVGELNPADVQIDMIMFGLRTYDRVPHMHIRGGGRENKYSLTRSPFVDLGFHVRDSGFGVVVGDKEDARDKKLPEDIAGLRMNTITTHLTNAHPDYPGLSEMPGPNTSWDQRYISPAEFVKFFYVPPPTKDEALVSLRYDPLPTHREKAWVGPIQERY